MIVVMLLTSSTFSLANNDSKIDLLLRTVYGTEECPHRGYLEHPDNGKLLYARLDSNENLVFGTPYDVPGNNWRPTTDPVHPGGWAERNPDVARQSDWGKEPAFLGHSSTFEKFSNDWYPPSREHRNLGTLNLIKEPWNKSGIDCQGNNTNLNLAELEKKAIVDAIKNYGAALSLQYNGKDKGSFENNPLLTNGNFEDNVFDYFLVLSKPYPGVSGTVRYWHKYNGITYYDTITVHWSQGPDFYLENLNPNVYDNGGQPLYPGKTYQGKVIAKVQRETGSYMDPITQKFLDVSKLEDKRPTFNKIPIYVTIDGAYLNPTNIRSTQTGLGINGGVAYLDPMEIDREYPIDFFFTVPSDYNKTAIEIKVVINTFEADGFIPPGIAPNGAEQFNLANNMITVSVPVGDESKGPEDEVKLPTEDLSVKSMTVLDAASDQQVTSVKANQPLKIQAVFNSTFPEAGWVKLRLYKHQVEYNKLDKVGDTVIAHMDANGTLNQEWPGITIGTGEYAFVVSINAINKGNDPNTNWEIEKYTTDTGEEFKEADHDTPNESNNKLAYSLTGSDAPPKEPQPVVQTQSVWFPPKTWKLVEDYRTETIDIYGWREVEFIKDPSKARIITRMVPNVEKEKSEEPEEW
ncbi:MAG: Athe_2463 domain-containing protein [Bacillota bacterium]